MSNHMTKTSADSIVNNWYSYIPKLYKHLCIIKIEKQNEKDLKFDMTYKTLKKQNKTSWGAIRETK